MKPRAVLALGDDRLSLDTLLLDGRGWLYFDLVLEHGDARLAVPVRNLVDSASAESP